MPSSDVRPAAGRGAHEVAALHAAHGEPAAVEVAVDEHLVELELGVGPPGLGQRAADHLVERGRLGLAHRLRRVAVQPDAIVVQVQVAGQITGVPRPAGSSTRAAMSTMARASSSDAVGTCAHSPPAPARISATARSRNRSVIQRAAKATNGTGVDQLAARRHRPGPLRRPRGRQVVARGSRRSSPARGSARCPRRRPGTRRPRRRARSGVATSRWRRTRVLVGHVGQVLGVVDRRHGADVGAEAQHLPPPLDQPRQRRAGPVVVVPRHIADERRRAAAPRREAPLRMIGHDRARRRAEHLGQHAVVGVGRRRRGVERFAPGQQRRPLVLRMLVDPGPVVAARRSSSAACPSSPTAASRAATTPAAPPSTGPMARSEACDMTRSPAATPSRRRSATSSSGGSGARRTRPSLAPCPATAAAI